MNPEPTRPDFAGACVMNVVPALMGRFDQGFLPAPAIGARAAVLLILDGIGWDAVQTHRALLPNLSSMQGGAITSVVPSTTATVLTSIATGAPPARHGIIGMRMSVGEHTLHCLLWAMNAKVPPPDPDTFQPVAPFFGRAVPVVTRSHFKHTGYSRAHLRQAQFFGWYTTSTLVERARKLIAAGEAFVYAYYDGLDHVAHVRGTRDSFYEVELEFCDRLVGELLDALPPDAALVVTADHGQMQFDADSWTEIDELHPMIRAYAGDARFKALVAKPGAADELVSAAREQFGARAWVMSREELATSGLLGPEPPEEEIAMRLGDVTLASKDGTAFVDPEFPEEVRLKASHGSMTANEMYVPLLAARGRQRPRTRP